MARTIRPDVVLRELDEHELDGLAALMVASRLSLEDWPRYPPARTLVLRIAVRRRVNSLAFDGREQWGRAIEQTSMAFGLSESRTNGLFYDAKKILEILTDEAA